MKGVDKIGGIKCLCCFKERVTDEEYAGKKYLVLPIFIGAFFPVIKRTSNLSSFVTSFTDKAEESRGGILAFDACLNMVSDTR